MEKMKTLTVSGQTYTVCDPEAVSFAQAQALSEQQQKNARENIGAATVKQIQDALCPVFTESAAVVTCTPAEGYPLTVVSNIVPVQSGSGIPGPDNIRHISGHTVVNMTLENGVESKKFTMDLGQTVYGGSLDWATGKLTITHFADVFDGTVKKFTGFGLVGDSIFCSARLSHSIVNNTATLCSHLRYQSASYAYGTYYITGNWNSDTAVYIKAFEDISQANNWLAQQMADGTPFTMCYELAEPITVQLDAQQILGLSGENVLCSDTGDTLVTGRGDLVAELERLKAAVLSVNKEE